MGKLNRMCLFHIAQIEGEKPDPNRHLDKIEHFKGNEVRDGRGHVGKK